ncbi:outer membrane beta-barrel family protein [Rhizosphaericola mali]|uniref:Outer membrane beta-barrel protein n=1 Tax=Rhizosphaericola mali TaxID=2545455 RepID=A0A5P2FUQ5_9BACT|nr:outer membrane beta-barrel family protein [Rhizosphaericola mali]QES87184.1 outer membrane beta-barrel protein [Rhizosphaericola mali]
MTKKLATLCLFLLSFILGKSQVQINGTITDSKANAIAYATIEFIHNNESTVKITDSIGVFQITLKDTGLYTIKMTAFNYNDSSFQYEITTSTSKLNLSLQENSSNLDGVVVSSTKKKPLIQRKLDRVVMNVEDNPVAAGRSSLQLFSMAPGVFVNNGSISINGVGGTKVMINGKLLKLSGDELKQYLQTLKASDIQSIEVIAHPPAEYDAEGAGGLINIILKKSAKQGWNGYIGNDYSIGLGKFPTYNPYASINYKHDKLELFAKYSYNWSKSFQDITQNRTLGNDGIYQSTTNSISYGKNNRVTLGANYDISQNQSISLEYIGSFNKNTDSLNSNTTITYPSNTSLNSNAIGKYPSTANTNYSDYSLSYKLKTDSLGSSLSLVSDYIYNNRNANNANNANTYSYDNTLISDTNFIFHNPSNSKIWTADLQYNQKFKSGMQLSFGGKSTITRINNGNAYSIENNQIWATAPDLGFNYHYSENIFAGFFNLTGNIWKTDYKIGLRAENSDIDGQLYGTTQSDTNHYTYFNIFPDIFLQHNLDSVGNHALSLSVNRRLSRPGYSDLNPFKYYIDNYSVNQGNPYLRPMYTNSIEVGYTYKGQYYTSFGYSRSTNVINQVIETNDENANMIIMRQNAGINNALSMTFSIPVKFTKWWESSNNLVLQYASIKASQYYISKTTFQLQTMQSFTIPKLFNMTINGFYVPRFLTGNIVTGRIMSIDWGISKNFFKNKLTAKANISDIFYTNNFKAQNYYNNTQIHLSQKEQSRIATLSLIYNFSIGKAFRAKQIKNSNSEESKRL